MALEPAIHEEPIISPSTSLGNGITVKKQGNIVFIERDTATTVSRASAGWIEVCTLPSEYKPKRDIRFVGIDNGAPTQGQISVLCAIDSSTGKLSAYVFADRLTIALGFCISYILA